MTESLEHNNIQNKTSRIKYIIAAGIVLCVITGYICNLLIWKSKTDPASEKVIREVAALQLNKDPNKLTNEDFKEITELSIYRKELYDIKFLKKFTNLRRLYLVSIKSQDTHIPIFNKILVKIGIIKRPVINYIDLKPIENLSKLEELILDGVLIKSFEPVKNLTNLNTLACNGVDVFDFDLVKGLTNLKSIWVSFTGVHNFETIKNLKQLEHLWLWEVKVSDLEPVRELTNMKRLILQGLPISDLEAVKDLKKLERITIERCENISEKQIEDLKQTFPDTEIEYIDAASWAPPVP